VSNLPEEHLNHSILWCVKCGRVAAFRCDWQEGTADPCDRPLCVFHAKPLGNGKHLCPRHVRVHKFEKAKQKQEERSKLFAA